MPQIVSLFSGAGLMDLGFEQAGCEVVTAVEWDGRAVETWRHNRRGAEGRIHHADVREVTAECLGIQPGTIDGLIGGPPCQGFSAANNQRPQAGGNVHLWRDDPRNLLYREYVRLLGELQPRWFVMENVRTMFSTGADATGEPGPIMREVLADLTGTGYRVAAKVLNAADYGVPQLRERTIVIGIRPDVPGPILYPAQTHGEPGSGHLHHRTVREAIADLPPPGVEPSNHEPTHDDGRRTIEVLAEWGMADRPTTTLAADSRLGRPGNHHNLRQAQTIPRRLTPRECARLQTVPDAYVFCGPKTAIHRQIGNGVPVELARRVAAAILGLETGIEETPHRPQMTLFDRGIETTA